MQKALHMRTTVQPEARWTLPARAGGGADSRRGGAVRVQREGPLHHGNP